LVLKAKYKADQASNFSNCGDCSQNNKDNKDEHKLMEFGECISQKEIQNSTPKKQANTPASGKKKNTPDSENRGSKQKCNRQKQAKKAIALKIDLQQITNLDSSLQTSPNGIFNILYLLKSK